MPDSTKPGYPSREDLLENILSSWYWKIFFALLALIGGFVGIPGNVPAIIRGFALGILSVALLAFASLVLGDVRHWLDQNAYRRSSAYDFNARLYGLGYESLKITAFLRRDGSMTIKRHIQLKAFTDGVQKIDHYMFAREAPPNGQTIQASIVGHKPQTIALTLTTVEAPSEKRITGIVNFSHPLRKGQVLEYTYEEKLPPGSFALTKTELEKRHMEFEYVAWDIVRPTKDFTLKVQMTPDTPIENPEHNVWFGTTRTSHEKEYSDTQQGWKDDQSEPVRELVLDVPQPILGLTYVIKWIPALPEAVSTPASPGSPVN